MFKIRRPLVCVLEPVWDRFTYPPYPPSRWGGSSRSAKNIVNYSVLGQNLYFARTWRGGSLKSPAGVHSFGAKNEYPGHFGAGVPHFGAGVRSFGAGVRSFGATNVYPNNFGERVRCFGAGLRCFGLGFDVLGPGFDVPWGGAWRQRTHAFIPGILNSLGGFGVNAPMHLCTHACTHTPEP